MKLRNRRRLKNKGLNRRQILKKKNQTLVKRDMRQEVGAVMVSWIDRAGDGARDRGSSVGGCGGARGRLQAEGRAGKDSWPRINNSTLNKPPRTPGRKT